MKTLLNSRTVKALVATGQAVAMSMGLAGAALSGGCAQDQAKVGEVTDPMPVGPVDPGTHVDPVSPTPHDFTPAPDTMAPVVIGMTPATGTGELSSWPELKVTFSEPVDLGTINEATVQLNTASAGAVPCDRTMSGTTLVVAPAGFPVPGTSYTLTVTAGVKDLAGNSLGESTVTSFSIKAPAVTAPGPLVTGPSGASYQRVALLKKMSWEEARVAAEAMEHDGQKGRLATIGSQQEWDFVRSSLGSSVQRCWLGAKQDKSIPLFAEPAGGFAWITGEPFAFQGFAPGDPNNLSGEDYLVAGGVEDASWWDVPADFDADGFIVEYDEIEPLMNEANGNHYLLIEGDTPSWEQAEAIAETAIYQGQRGHLATITSPEENEVVQALIGPAVNQGYFWLGGRQIPGSAEPAGGWTWVTGEPFAALAWGPGEPNDYYGEHHLVTSAVFDGAMSWNDLRSPAEPGQVKGFVIEFDSAGSCEGSCGQQSPGGCYCDAKCASMGDCCVDVNAACGSTVSPDSCEGNCGDKAPSGCYCDSQCDAYGDCCADKKQVCGS